MSERSAAILLEDMRDAAAKIARYVQGKNAAAFLADEQCEDACVRNLEIIGEAASRLPEKFLSAHPEVDWRKIVGLRNRIVHGYFGVDFEIVWRIITFDPPLLREFLDRQPSG
jgi:uncharacterized protein with HEPN domain